MRLTFLLLGIVLIGCGDGEGGDGEGGGNETGPGGTTGAGETGPATGSGGGGSVADCTVFPADNPWNQDITSLAVHPDSDAFIDSIGRDTALHADFGTVWEGAPIGIPYVTVGGSQAKVPIEFVAYGEESDPGPYPIPADAPIEGGPDGDGDRHVIAIDTDACMLYELYRGFPQNGGASWEADSGAVFDLKTNDHHPEQWTSADAAGLPIFPGLARYDEVVEKGVVPHALRFTVSSSQMGYIFPARHYASDNADPSLPPMGLRVRMKAAYDCSGYSSEVQVLCAGFKKYGMIVADNGSDWYVSGAPDARWSDEALADIANITGDAFEVVYTGDVETY